MSKKSAQKENIPTFSSVEKLSPDFNVSQFSCGKPVLDEWLRKYALTNQRSGMAQTYVVHREMRVVGYYAISAGSVSRDFVPARIAKGVPNHPIPVALLARLAIDQTVQGQGLGEALLKDAMLRIHQAADILGVRAILVYALDEEARAFYEKFDFVSSPLNDMQLMFLMKDLRALL